MSHSAQMDDENSLPRLEGLQRDLIAFSENRLKNVERLLIELEASVEDFRRLLDKKKKSEESRKLVNPTSTPKPDTLTIRNAEYRITDDFRQAVLQVSDEIDLNEVEAAAICVDAESELEGSPDGKLSYLALIHFHNHRCTLLDCLRLLLVQSLDAENELALPELLQGIAHKIIRGKEGGPDESSSYWKRCIDGWSEVETLLQKVEDHKQAALVTGVALEGAMAEFLTAQRLLLLRQHELLGAIISHLVGGGYAGRGDFRMLLSKAAGLPSDAAVGIMINYFPSLIGSAAYFGADNTITPESAKELHSLFATGPGQLQWKSRPLKAATTVFWLAEYASRFVDPTNTGTLRVADRQKEEEERRDLFLQCVNDNAFHFILAACQSLKPDSWYDPAKAGLVRFLLEDQSRLSASNKTKSSFFGDLVMNELQAFCEAAVANIPDVLRRLKVDEDDRRRAQFSLPNSGDSPVQLHLERFMAIMAYAYEGDTEAAQDFWADKESNLYGFVRWASQRLPTPRVAVFCELLISISSSDKTANQTHRFLLEDTAVAPGKLRKSYSVCWSQVFSELDLYAKNSRNRLTAPQQPQNQDGKPLDESLQEPETYIMLEAYMRLAAHICRTSPEARNWILRDQPFHLGEILIQLASTGQESRLHASCFDMLSALLVNKSPEVNDGTWVLFDNWVNHGGQPAASGRQTAVPHRQAQSALQYLQSFASTTETATSLVNLLNALILPSSIHDDLIHDHLPFPESLGVPYRNAGIDAYVDFVFGTAFRSTNLAESDGIDKVQIDVLRCACLDFALISLSKFNDNLVALANTTNVAVDSAMRASSLAAYARLHPFTRVMEWLLNDHVISALASTTAQNLEDLESLDLGSPKVQATIRSITVMNLAMRLEATYFDILRPLVKRELPERTQVANLTLASFDEVMLDRLEVMAKITSFTTSSHIELSLESLILLQQLCASRKLGDKPQYASNRRMLLGTRFVGRIADISDQLAPALRSCFQIYPWDLDNDEQPMKLVKARAVVDMLNSSLDISPGTPSVAHCFLGFQWDIRDDHTAPTEAFLQGRSLFHAIAEFAATSPYAIVDSNISWLLSVKRGCMDVILKIALSSMTTSLVTSELRNMDFLGASCQNLTSAFANQLWDQRPLDDVESLMGGPANAVQEFVRLRASFLEYAALELRTASERSAFSVREKVMGALLGTIRYPSGERAPVLSVFDLIDFFDLHTQPAFEVSYRYFDGVELAACIKTEGDVGTMFDVQMATELLALRKRELIVGGRLKEINDDQQIEDEMRAIVASLISQNNFHAMADAQLCALEAWIDLMCLMVTAGGLEQADLSNVANQGLLVVLPRYDQVVLESPDAAALFAKLVLVLVPAASTLTSQSKESHANVASERLLLAFRVCLKATTDGDTNLALRDVCYRTCCAIFRSLPMVIVNGKSSTSSNAKLLLQLVQSAGDRLISVITEDAFSERGVTRVSALLLLDAVLGLCQLTQVTPTILQALTKLNFVPVLIDQSISSISSTFGSSNDELATAVAYFHVALSVMLRICQTAEGSQLVLDSGFLSAVADSRLFTTDPDIGLDIDNPVALRAFFRLLSSVLRVLTAAVIAKGPSSSITMQQARDFLRQSRFSMQAVFKRTSAVQKTAGPPEKEADDVAEEFSKLLLVTGFIEDDEPVHMRGSGSNRFT